MNNRILKALPARDYRILSSQLKPVMLQKGTVLHEAGERIRQVYFPDESMISYLSGTAEGESVEICVVGNEGVVGIAALLSDSTAFRAVVQIPGSAVSISREHLRREFKKCESLHRMLLHYTNALLIQVVQTAVCNKFHSVEERFCRWLLLAHDRVGTDNLPLTQDAIARILGSRRASVSVVAGGVQEKGVIEYSRGIITIRDRKRLESLACECYGTISGAHSKIDSHS
ncbi:MAG TPA: Crp/Fnr family transcriptional regulator [Terriglobia bacterium]|nr:Crp/Fnr family transcriptional regulator [Terriglobia bacterium]